MYKRGQVTIFIIVAIVIVASAAAILLLVQTQKTAESPEVKEIRNYVESCLDQVSVDAVISIGQQGGYYNLPEKSRYFLFFPAPYYIYENDNFVPVKVVLERELGKYIENNLDFCFNDFIEFKNRGLDIRKRSNIAVAKISSDKVLINAKISISLTKGNSTSIIEDFSSYVGPVRFESILRASNDIASSETIDPRTLCVTCINNIIESYNMSVKILDTEDRNEFIFTLIDESSNFTGFPYEYSFAARYKFPDCTTTEECFNKLA